MSKKTIQNLEELKKIEIGVADGDETPVENSDPVESEQKLGLVDRAYVAYCENKQKVAEKKAAKQAAKAEKKAAKEAKKAEKKPTKHLKAKIAAGAVIGGALLAAGAKLAMDHYAGDQTIEDRDEEETEDEVDELDPLGETEDEEPEEVNED